MSQDHIHGVGGVGAQRVIQVRWVGDCSAHQNLVQQGPADWRHESEGDFKGTVLPAFTWEGDIQVHLQRTDCLPQEFPSEPTLFGSLCKGGGDSHPTNGDRKWAGGVEAALAVVNRQPFPEDCHLKVLHHGVHHLPEERNSEIGAFILKNGLPGHRNSEIGDFILKNGIPGVKNSEIGAFVSKNDLLGDRNSEIGALF